MCFRQTKQKQISMTHFFHRENEFYIIWLFVCLMFWSKHSKERKTYLNLFVECLFVCLNQIKPKRLPKMIDWWMNGWLFWLPKKEKQDSNVETFQIFFWFVKRFRKRSSKDLRKSSHRHNETHDIRREHFNIPQSKTLIKSRRPWLFSTFRSFVRSLSHFTHQFAQTAAALIVFIFSPIYHSHEFFSFFRLSFFGHCGQKALRLSLCPKQKLAPNFINLNLAIFLQIDTRCRSICSVLLLLKNDF